MNRVACPQSLNSCKRPAGVLHELGIDEFYFGQPASKSATKPGMLSTIKRKFLLTAARVPRRAAFGDFLSQHFVGCSKFCGPLRDALIEFVATRFCSVQTVRACCIRSTPGSPLCPEEVPRYPAGNLLDKTPLR